MKINNKIKNRTKKSNKKANIPIETMIVLFVAVISVALLIGLFSSKIPGFSKALYCKTIYHIHSASFIPSSIRQSQTYCEKNSSMYTTILDGADKTSQVESITAFAVACWKLSDYGLKQNNFVCYNVVVPETTTTITIIRQDVVNTLNKNNLAEILPSKELDVSTLKIVPKSHLIVEYIYNKAKKEGTVKIS